jgi:hypothetical protein
MSSEPAQPVHALQPPDPDAKAIRNVLLKSLSIKAFRLFRDLDVGPLARVNLIAGENDTGKTALLEALYLLFADRDQFERFPSALRSSQADDLISFWKWLPVRTNDFAADLNLKAVSGAGDVLVTIRKAKAKEIAFDQDDASHRTVRRRLVKESGVTEITETHKSPQGPVYVSGRTAWDNPRIAVFSTMPSLPSGDAETFSEVSLVPSARKRVIELLRVVEPRLVDLQYLKPRGAKEAAVYADLGLDELIPTTQLGRGFCRLLRLYSETLSSKAKIVLIDEIENGIHHVAMSKVWEAVAAIAREDDLQVFATTHSYECIKSAHAAFSSGDNYDLALHRLEWRGDRIKALTYDRTAIETSIDMNLEVR